MEYAEIHKLIKEELKEASKPIAESYNRILVELKENKDILTDVRLQTTKTNWRVNRLEDSKIQHWEDIAKLENEVKNIHDIHSQVKWWWIILNKVTVIIIWIISIIWTITSIIQSIK